MDPEILREYEVKLNDWLAQGYQILADDVDGELRLTVHFVSRDGAVGSEREQEFWPMTAEIVQMLTDNDIPISKALAGPRPWAGPHPEER
jgi:hypothetical protein